MRGHGGLISSLVVRSKRGQTGPNRARVHLQTPFPRRREPRILSLSGCRGGSRTARTPCHPQHTPNPQTNDNCPLRHSAADCYIGLRCSCLRGNDASLPRVDDRKSNQMQPNATELKVSSLLGTPDEANQGHNQGQLAHRVRVSAVPNEATVASFPASSLGVNEAKQGQIGPGFTPPRRSRESSGPFSLEGRRLG